MFSNDQINHILSIFDKQIAFFAARTLGTDVLSDQEKQTLSDAGVDVRKLQADPAYDLVTLNFHLGLLSNVLSSKKIREMPYEQLVKYIESGNYIPLTQKEQAIIASIKRQSLSDIRSAKGKIFSDINNVVNKEFLSNRANQEQFIRDKIQNTRVSRKNIAQEIARLTGDWSRDFDKSVQYISHTALNEGRASLLERRSGKEAKVYFQVQPDACESCKGAYLKKGSNEPIVFPLSSIQANGNNIGKKQRDWLPTINAIHPACRCLLSEYIEGTVWDGVKFVAPKDRKTTVERPKIRIVFNNQEYFV